MFQKLSIYALAFFLASAPLSNALAEDAQPAHSTENQDPEKKDDPKKSLRDSIDDLVKEISEDESKLTEEKLAELDKKYLEEQEKGEMSKEELAKLGDEIKQLREKLAAKNAASDPATASKSGDASSVASNGSSANSTSSASSGAQTKSPAASNPLGTALGNIGTQMTVNNTIRGEGAKPTRSSTGSRSSLPAIGSNRATSSSTGGAPGTSTTAPKAEVTTPSTPISFSSFSSVTTPSGPSALSKDFFEPARTTASEKATPISSSSAKSTKTSGETGSGEPSTVITKPEASGTNSAPTAQGEDAPRGVRTVQATIMELPETTKSPASAPSESNSTASYEPPKTFSSLGYGSGSSSGSYEMPSITETSYAAPESYSGSRSQPAAQTYSSASSGTWAEAAVPITNSTTPANPGGSREIAEAPKLSEVKLDPQFKSDGSKAFAPPAMTNRGLMQTPTIAKTSLTAIQLANVPVELGTSPLEQLLGKELR